MRSRPEPSVRSLRARALDLLARRDHSAAELRCKLGRRGESPEEIEALLRRLAEEGLLDEGRFARGYARRRAGRGFGKARILQELLERGVDRAQAETALEETELPDELDQALELARRRHASGRSQASIARFLQSRGFPHAVVQKTLSILRERGLPRL